MLTKTIQKHFQELNFSKDLRAVYVMSTRELNVKGPSEGNWRERGTSAVTVPAQSEFTYFPR